MVVTVRDRRPLAACDRPPDVISADNPPKIVGIGIPPEPFCPQGLAEAGDYPPILIYWLPGRGVCR